MHKYVVKHKKEGQKTPFSLGNVLAALRFQRVHLIGSNGVVNGNATFAVH